MTLPPDVPSQPPPPVKWVAWRRQKHQAWERAVGPRKGDDGEFIVAEDDNTIALFPIESPVKAEVIQFIAWCGLLVGELPEWEYNVVPDGEMPKGTGGQGYLDRAMRPRWGMGG